MATGTRHDFDMHRGDARWITATVVDENGDVIDLTGLTGTALSWAMARLDPEEDDPSPRGTSLAIKTLADGITLVDAEAGKIRITLDETDTTSFRAPEDYYHELQLTLISNPSTIIFGIITLMRDLVDPGP